MRRGGSCHSCVVQATSTGPCTTVRPRDGGRGRRARGFRHGKCAPGTRPGTGPARGTALGTGPRARAGHGPRGPARARHSARAPGTARARAGDVAGDRGTHRRAGAPRRQAPRQGSGGDAVGVQIIRSSHLACTRRAVGGPEIYENGIVARRRRRKCSVPLW